jgi:signal transduction histidine kinase
VGGRAVVFCVDVECSAYELEGWRAPGVGGDVSARGSPGEPRVAPPAAEFGAPPAPGEGAAPGAAWLPAPEPSPGDSIDVGHIGQLIAMGQMLADFAHEVRNPLAALKSLIDDLALDTPPDDPRAETLERAGRLVRRVEGLVRGTLRLGAPTASLRRPCATAKLVEAAVEVLAQRLLPAGGELRPQVEPGLPPALVDEGQIVQALTVVLSNALDAAGGPQGVRVRAGRAPPREGGAVRLEIEDDGGGIAPEALGRIFDPFFTTKPGGMGLGLPIALRLVRENGGRLYIRTRPGAGTTVAIELPTVPEGAPAP